jgi:hypothetical protein
MPSDKNDQKESDKKTPDTNVKKDANEAKKAIKNSQKLPLSDKNMAIGLVVVFVLLLGGMAVVTYSYAKHDDNKRFTIESGLRNFDGNRMHRGMQESRGMRGTYGPDSNQIVVSGVVTAVEGQSFTIAGNGTTNRVTTNSKTKYNSDSKVSVNDTVTVVGNVNNNTFTAAQVVVKNKKL